MNRPVFILIAGLAVMRVALDGQTPEKSQPSPKTSAPFDLSGYWVSVITQNWRLRMVPPAKGDYAGIPLTEAAKKAADNWDPARDEAMGNQCRYYGAGLIMTLPERLHFTWQDDNTLRMDVDAGTQTRLFHFGNWKAATGAPRTLQGDSNAAWAGRYGPDLTPPSSKASYLRVHTTRMLPAYLRRNGIPYSENAVQTEYYDLLQEPDGTQMLIVTTELTDPVNLQFPLILSAQFRKQNDAAGWEATPCSARW